MLRTHLNFWPLGAGGSFIFALFHLFLSAPLYAGSGTEAASFLDIPVGAGPAALGSAYSALATDAYAPTWNPGGLGFVDSTQLSGQHLDYLESIHYEYLSFVHPLAKGRALGGAAQYLGSGDIAGTDKSGNSIGDFSSHFAAYSLAYGQMLGEQLALGITGRIINAKISDVSATAYAGDIGALYKPTSKLRLAAVVTNMGSKLTFLNDGGTLPLTYKASVAYQPISVLTVAAEGDYANYGLASGHFGAEWRPIQMIALRAGYRTDNTKQQNGVVGVTTGIGLTVWGQELAYAWVPYGDLGNTQYFSLLIRFGQAEEGKRNLIQYQNIKTHRTAKKGAAEVEHSDPEYQQLMQLLSDQDREMYSRKSTFSGDAQ